MMIAAVTASVVLVVAGWPHVGGRATLNRTLILCLKSTQCQRVPCVISLLDDDDRARYHRGINAVRSGRPSEAIAPLRAHLLEEPHDDVAGYYLGIAYRQMGREDAALKVWRDSGAVSAFVAMGWRDGSIDALQTAIEAGEGSFGNFYKLGDLLWDAGREREARAVYVRGVALDRRDGVQALLARGRIAEADGDWSRAIAIDARAAERQPGNSHGFFRIADIYRRQLKSPDRAIAWFSLCVEKTKAMPCYLGAGEVSLTRGDLNGALGWGTEARATFPRESAPLLFLGSVWQVIGRFEEGARAYAEAAAVDPKNFWIPLYRGDLAVRGGDAAAALRYYKEAERLNPTSPSVYLALGSVQRKSGNVDGAVASYRKALELAPGSAHATNALAEMAAAGH